MAQEKAFRANRVTRTACIMLNGPVRTVFPLFGPIEEKKWAWGWNPRIIFPATNNVEPKMVFKTGHGNNDETDYTWVVSKLDPQLALIEYTVFAGNRVWWITIQCQGGPSIQTTRAEITYTFTGLTEEGNARIVNQLAHVYACGLADWERAINYFLKTGKTLREMQ